jgi:hypothetical protein
MRAGSTPLVGGGDTDAVGQWRGWIEFLPREGKHRIDATIGSVS